MHIHFKKSYDYGFNQKLLLQKCQYFPDFAHYKWAIEGATHDFSILSKHFLPDIDFRNIETITDDTESRNKLKMSKKTGLFINAFMMSNAH